MLTDGKCAHEIIVSKTDPRERTQIGRLVEKQRGGTTSVAKDNVNEAVIVQISGDRAERLLRAVQSTEAGIGSQDAANVNQKAALGAGVATPAVGFYYIKVLIVVHVCEGDLVRGGDRARLRDDTLAKGAQIACRIRQQVVVASVPEDDVRVTVAIDVTDRDGKRLHATARERRGCESTLPRPRATTRAQRDHGRAWRESA